MIKSTANSGLDNERNALTTDEDELNSEFIQSKGVLGRHHIAVSVIDAGNRQKTKQQAANCLFFGGARAIAPSVMFLIPLDLAAAIIYLNRTTKSIQLSFININFTVTQQNHLYDYLYMQ